MSPTHALRSASPAKTRADAVVVGVLQGKDGPQLAPGAEDVAAAFGRRLRPLLSSLGVTGATDQTVLLPTTGAIRSPLILLVGLGTSPGTDAVRRAAGTAARSVPNASSVALALPADTPELVDAVTQGHLLGGYRYAGAASSDDTSGRAPSGGARPATDGDSPGSVSVLSPIARTGEATAAFERALVVAAAVGTTREWVNTPPGDFTPEHFAAAVSRAHACATRGREAPRIDIEVLDESDLADLGCGGILAVGASSDAPPRLVRLTYRHPDPLRHIALVGKGVTFDSGGLTIKPGASMREMKSDMGGAAAVVQATLALAALEAPVEITCLAPMAENMISGRASRPGDVLTTRNGTTVELANLDAEGRLLLCDALALAVESEPDLVVDVATLTGHMQVALGDQVAGVMGDPDLREAVVAAGQRAGETHWPMPIPEEMSERIRASRVADLLQHDWVRWGGGLFAAAFLREFTGGLPWAHIDFAGCEFTSGGSRGHITPGATGWGTATVVALVEALLEDAAAGG